MTVVDLYTIQIIIDDGAPFTTIPFYNLAELMAETEENLTDLLPDGIRASIKVWHHPDPDEGDPE